LKVITFSNQKGGVGKTTSCINLGFALSLYKKRVLLIDFDTQGNLTSGLGIDKNKKGIFDFLLSKEKLENVIIERARNLYIIPFSYNFSDSLHFDELSRKFKILKQKEFDFILIDTPPSLGILSVYALAFCDSVLIPVQAEYYSLEGLIALLDTIKKVKARYNPYIKIEGFLLTMYDSRLLLSKHIEKELRNSFGEKVFKTVIPRNVRIAEAPSFGKSIFEYAPSSQGAISYLNLAKEVLKIEKPQKSLRSVP
jgi:chromosome partitioning protein